MSNIVYVAIQPGKQIRLGLHREGLFQRYLAQGQIVDPEVTADVPEPLLCPVVLGPMGQSAVSTPVPSDSTCKSGRTPPPTTAPHPLNVRTSDPLSAGTNRLRSSVRTTSTPASGS